MTNSPRVQRALIDLIAKSPAFRTRQVSLMHPGSLLEMESVFIQQVQNREQARAVGKAHRREVLAITLGLLAEVNADDMQDAFDRAYRMLNDIEDVIAANPDLGVEHVLFAQVTGWDQQNFAGDGRRAVEMTVDVEVTANKDLEV